MNNFEPTVWVWKPSEALFDGSVPIEIHNSGNGKYAVRQASGCMSKRGKWEYEPMPSSRTDAFLKRFRFDSLEAAQSAIEKYCKPEGRFAKATA